MQYSEETAGAPTPSSQPSFGGLPDRNADQFYDTTPSDNWTQNITLAPLAQQTLDKQMGLSNEYADLAQTGLEKARGVLSDPTLDMSAIPQRAMNVGQTGQDAIMARLNPQFQQQEEALRTRLANQGITDTGSEAYKNDFRNFNQGRNDAEMQAALYGIGLDNQNRQSAIQEQAYMQDRPLNLVNALRTGAQVQNPTFSAVPQQAATKGPDLMNAANGQFQADLGATNANNASSASHDQRPDVGGWHGRDDVLMLDHLAFWYQVIVASEPLLAQAILRLSDEGFEGELKAFYRKHLQDERHHAEWLREDLEDHPITFRIEAARLAGLQYYLITHVHPVCLMGYMQVLEGNTPAPEFIEQVKAELGPRARTFLLHVEQDPHHFEELCALPIPDEFKAMVEMSRRETLQLLKGL
jgi:hypothetical protein